MSDENIASNKISYRVLISKGIKIIRTVASIPHLNNSLSLSMREELEKYLKICHRSYVLYTKSLVDITCFENTAQKPL